MGWNYRVIKIANKKDLKAVIIGFLLGVISYLLSAVRLNFIQATIISIILAIIFACVSYITIGDQIEWFNCEPYYYQIMETYYDEQGEPNGFGDAALISETYETLNNNLKLIKEAFSKPVIIVNENFMVTGYENNKRR